MLNRFPIDRYDPMPTKFYRVGEAPHEPEREPPPPATSSKEMQDAFFGVCPWPAPAVFSPDMVVTYSKHTGDVIAVSPVQAVSPDSLPFHFLANGKTKEQVYADISGMPTAFSTHLHSLGAPVRGDTSDAREYVSTWEPAAGVSQSITIQQGDEVKVTPDTFSLGDFRDARVFKNGVLFGTVVDGVFTAVESTSPKLPIPDCHVTKHTMAGSSVGMGKGPHYYIKTPKPLSLLALENCTSLPALHRQAGEEPSYWLVADPTWVRQVQVREGFHIRLWNGDHARIGEGLYHTADLNLVTRILSRGINAEAEATLRRVMPFIPVELTYA